MDELLADFEEEALAEIAQQEFEEAEAKRAEQEGEEARSCLHAHLGSKAGGLGRVTRVGGLSL